MKKLLFCLVLFAISNNIFAQRFNDCVAACIDEVAIIKEYSPRAKAEIQSDAKGNLAVYTVSIGESNITPKQKIRFKVAIKDAATQTLWLFSDQNYQEIAVEDILVDCKKGDAIMLLTVDHRYALPHHEILVN